MPKKPPLPAEVRDLFRQARAAEADAPRKHHLVPASYLRRWEDDGRLRVTDLDRDASWITSAEKALRETDFYDLRSEDLDPGEVPPLLMETVLGKVESQALPALGRLLGTSGPFSPEDRFLVTNLIAFQFTRGRSVRAEMKFLSNEYFKIVYGGLSAEGIRELLARRGPDPTAELVEETERFLRDLREGRLWVGPQRAQLAHEAAEMALVVAPYLFERVWVRCTTRPLLPATDEPVVPIAGPGSSRVERAGIGEAGVVVWPIAPNALLVLVRPDLAERWGLPYDVQSIHSDSLDHLRPSRWSTSCWLM